MKLSLGFIPGFFVFMPIFHLKESAEPQLVTAQELVDKFVPERLPDGSKPVVGADMDLTLFKSDIGILVFLQKLKTPDFWHFDQTIFQNLLLPPEYREAMTEGKVIIPGTNPPIYRELNKTHCRLGLALHRAICKLYALKKELIKNGDPVNIHTPIINEFTRKMLEYDRVIMKLEPDWLETFKTWLMRTRFFLGHDIKKIGTLTRQAMAIGLNDPERFLELNVSANNQYDREVTSERLEDDLGEISPFEHLDTSPRPVEEMVAITRELVKRAVPTLVVSTNLWSIVDKAVRSSEPYQFLTEQGRQWHVGSKLILNKDGTLGSRLSELIVAEGKTREATRFAESENGTLWVFAGDSPFGDGHAMRKVAENGGIPIIVSSTLEEGMKKATKIFANFNQQTPQGVLHVCHGE